MPFDFQRLGIPDVVLVKPRVYGDPRGFFLEVFKGSEFRVAGLEVDVVQVNHSRSNGGVLRGLHYQLEPKAQGKLIRVVRGRALDVAVDVRRGSPSFGEHVAVELTGDDPRALWIPPGFAHGVYAVESGTDLQYLLTEEYSPEHERGIDAFDPELAVPWPVGREEAILSERDAGLPRLADAELPELSPPDGFSGRSPAG